MEICILCVRVIINKRSFEPFSCVCVFGSTFFARQTGQTNPRYFQYQTLFSSGDSFFKVLLIFFNLFSVLNCRRRIRFLRKLPAMDLRSLGRRERDRTGKIADGSNHFVFSRLDTVKCFTSVMSRLVAIYRPTKESNHGDLHKPY